MNRGLFPSNCCKINFPVLRYPQLFFQAVQVIHVGSEDGRAAIPRVREVKGVRLPRNGIQSELAGGLFVWSYDKRLWLTIFERRDTGVAVVSDVTRKGTATLFDPNDLIENLSYQSLSASLFWHGLFLRLGVAAQDWWLNGGS